MDLEDDRFGDGAKGPQNGRGNEQRKDELTHEAPLAPNAAPIGVVSREGSEIALEGEMTAAALLGGLGHPAARPCRGGALLSHVVTDNSLKSGLPLARE